MSVRLQVPVRLGWVLIGLAVAAGAVANEGPQILAVAEVPVAAAVRAREGQRETEPSPITSLGGFSDLWCEPAAPEASGTGRHLWTLTDRGPNGIVKRPDGKFRTLLDPTFVPSLVRLRLDLPNGGGAGANVVIEEVRPLTGRGGRLLSGRPNGIGADEPAYDAAGTVRVPVDADGVDTEGFVRLADGSAWLAEEYRPSLLKLEQGRIVQRLVPRGDRLGDADTEVRDTLPPRYAARRDNRGFEALALSPDGSRLFALLQSPLENGGQRRTTGGLVRLLVLDAKTGTPVAEHVYPLDEATTDGKLCAMAALDADRLLVLEQGDGGRAVLHEAAVHEADDTLRQDDSTAWLEVATDLRGRGVRPVAKRQVADLSPLLAAMARHVHGPEGTVADGLKLEGMAILAPGMIAIVNDNDFGVTARSGRDAKSCVWIVKISGQF